MNRVYDFYYQGRRFFLAPYSDTFKGEIVWTIEIYDHELKRLSHTTGFKNNLEKAWYNAINYIRAYCHDDRAFFVSCAGNVYIQEKIDNV